MSYTALKTISEIVDLFDNVVMAEVGVEKGNLVRGLLNSNVNHKIKKYWAIDWWSKESSTQGTEEEQKSIFYLRDWGIWPQSTWDGMYSNVCRLLLDHENLNIIRLPSVEACKLFPDEYFDIVYVDAMHLHKYVKEDITIWKPKVKEGGIICGHDYGHVEHPEVSMAVHDVLGNDISIMGETVWMHRVEGGA